MNHAAQAYGNVAKTIASPRELEANLLLKAAARFQAISEGWELGQDQLKDALLFNRKLWTIFVTSATSGDNALPADVRQNVANLGLFVLKQTVDMTTDPQPGRLGALININRQLAAGLLGRA